MQFSWTTQPLTQFLPDSLFTLHCWSSVYYVKEIASWGRPAYLTHCIVNSVHLCCLSEGVAFGLLLSHSSHYTTCILHTEYCTQTRYTAHSTVYFPFGAIVTTGQCFQHSFGVTLTLLKWASLVYWLDLHLVFCGFYLLLFCLLSPTTMQTKTWLVFLQNNSEMFVIAPTTGWLLFCGCLMVPVQCQCGN